MSLYLDTNIFLNVIYKEPKFRVKSAELLRKVQAEEVTAITSAVTLLEVVLDMSMVGFKDQTEPAIAAIEDLYALTIVPLDKAMSKAAAQHVLDDKITVHDAYHLATALHSRVSSFVTRDASLSKKIRKYVKVTTPEETVSLRSSG